MKRYTDFAKDSVVHMRDDADVKAALFELGILNQLPDPQTFGKKSAFVIYDEHPTHWITAMRHSGFESPIDNGYMLDAFPKSRFKRDIFETVIRDALKMVPLCFRWNGTEWWIGFRHDA